MKYTFSDAVRFSDRSVKILSNAKLSWAVIYSIIINLITFLIINLMLMLFIKQDYFKYIICDFLYSSLLFNISLFIYSVILSVIFVIESKLQKSYSDFYYDATKEEFNNIFSREFSLFFSVILSLMLSLYISSFTRTYINSMDSLAIYLAILSCFLFPLTIIIFYIYFKKLLKFFLVVILEKWEFFYYNFINELNREIIFAKNNKIDFSLAVLRIDNLADIVLKTGIGAKKTVSIFLYFLNKQLRETDLLVCFDNKKGIAGFFERINTALMKEIVVSKVTDFFSNTLSYKGRNIKFNVSSEIHDIKHNKEIVDALDIFANFI